MATRSTIALWAVDGSVTVSYNHSDGYLDGVGATLYEHYSDVSKIRDHLSFGDSSSLGENVCPPHGQKQSFEHGQRIMGVTTFYGRDRGEEGVQAQVYSSIDEYKEHADFQGYDYIFKEKNKTWYLYGASSLKFKKLKTLLAKEAESSRFIKEMLERVREVEIIVAEKEAVHQATPGSPKDVKSITSKKI